VGSIDTRARPDGGTCVVQVQKRHHPGSDDRPGHALVCIVDDDPSVRTSLTRLIRGAQYRVEPFASASEFLARSPQHDGPACLVLDVRMPGLTGLDLQDALASTGPVDKRDPLEAIERAVS
jgi:CheY-like chemotaxis protein